MCVAHSLGRGVHAPGLGWQGASFGADRQGATGSAIPFSLFAGAERGAAEGCEDNRWDVAEGELGYRRDACRLGDQTDTGGRAGAGASACGKRDSGTCDKMGWGRDVRGRDGTARLRERDWDLHINFEMTGSASGRPTREAKRSQRRASPQRPRALEFSSPAAHIS